MVSDTLIIPRRADGTTVYYPGENTQIGAFLAAVPDDWHILYLGGQHILPPVEVAPGVVRCLGVKRTRAYLMRGAWIDQLP